MCQDSPTNWRICFRGPVPGCSIARLKFIWLIPKDIVDGLGHAKSCKVSLWSFLTIIFITLPDDLRCAGFLEVTHQTFKTIWSEWWLLFYTVRTIIEPNNLCSVMWNPCRASSKRYSIALSPTVASVLVLDDDRHSDVDHNWRIRKFLWTGKGLKHVQAHEVWFFLKSYFIVNHGWAFGSPKGKFLSKRVIRAIQTQCRASSDKPLLPMTSV